MNKIKHIVIFVHLYTIHCLCLDNIGKIIPSFAISPYFQEQVITFLFDPEVRISFNASSVKMFNPDKPMVLACYALPNGNTIGQTIGKHNGSGGDWHFDIRYIGAHWSMSVFGGDVIPEKLSMLPLKELSTGAFNTSITEFTHE